MCIYICTCSVHIHVYIYTHIYVRSPYVYIHVYGHAWYEHVRFPVCIKTLQHLRELSETICGDALAWKGLEEWVPQGTSPGSADVTHICETAGFLQVMDSLCAVLAPWLVHAACPAAGCAAPTAWIFPSARWFGCCE